MTPLLGAWFEALTTALAPTALAVGFGLWAGSFAGRALPTIRIKR